MPSCSSALVGQITSPGSFIWIALWLIQFVAAIALVSRIFNALLKTLPEEGTAVASMEAFKCVVGALMLLYAMAYALPRLAGVHNAMAGVASEQVIHGTSIDEAFTLDSPASDVLGAFAGLAESVYAILLTMGIQADCSAPVELTRDFLGYLGVPLPDLITYAYSFFLTAMCTIAPVALAAVAFTQAWDLLRRWQHVIMRYGHDDVYLFSGLGDAEVALAKSTFDRFRRDHKHRPLVIFCNVGADDRAEHADLVDNLTVLGRGSTIFTHRGIADVLPDLERDAHLLFWTFRHPFKQIYCFLLGDDYAANVTNAIDVIQIVTDKAAGVDPDTGVSPLDELELDEDGVAPSDQEDELQAKLFRRFADARVDARRFHVYCMHANQENELVFDSLAHGAADTEGREALSHPVRLVRLSMEVRLISRAREQTYDVLTRHPLYDVLDRPVYKPDHFAEDFMAEVDPQQVYVFVVGLGSYGLEALKTVYWIGRMRNVELHIVGIDKIGDEIGAALKVTCPEMMEEAYEDGTHVVSITQASVFTPEFNKVLCGVPANARIYSIITLGDDQLNLNVALSMRRIFDDMLRKDMMKMPGDSTRSRAEFPLILPLINSSELFEAADRMTSDRREAFRLEPFGMAEDVFSYHNIVEEPWERYALAMNAAYREVWEWRPERMVGRRGVDARLSADEIAAEYAEYEIKKLSNRTNVRHIPYRLWCLGMDPAEVIGVDGDLLGAGIDQARWMDLLGYDEAGAEELMSHHRGESKVDGVKTFDPERMRAEQDDLRRRFPVVCALAELEHERWLAFYRSEGWRDLTIEECDKLVSLGLIASRKVHQSPKLRLHCYMCSNEELLERGIALEDDPYTYDRAAVMETARILSQEVFW